jgi:bifunctional non-homologous end joining protein LigD
MTAATAKKSAKRSAKRTAAKTVKKATKAAAKTTRKATPTASQSTHQNASSAVDEQLARYRSMRDFHITAEPAGSKEDAKKTSNPTQLPFCIQKHAASHLHYDFRLGWNGVLKSWAVAKGPSYVVADKRLAVQVEDHPMEYGGFEGIIPAGQYGGGTVMLWDQGTWEPQPAYPDVDEGLRKGSLKFILHGTKLQGKWALIRMAAHPSNSSSQRANPAKPSWLLIKEHDDFERPPTEPSITESEPNSVVTGRTIDQIAKSEDHVWNSKDTRSGSKAWYSQPSKSAPEAPAEPPKFSIKIDSLPKESQPTFVSPQLAQQAETPPSNDGWLHELKLDGYRMQARKSGAKVQLLTRKGLDWTHRMPAVAAEVARLPADKLTLDGEVVVLRPDGTTNFADLQASFQESAKHHLTYFCFDLLHLDGHNTRNLPLRDRKALLAEILASVSSETLQFSDHLESDGPAIFQNACKMHAEGIISKRAAAKYCEGRSSDWIKCKCLHEQELVIGGYTLPGAGHTGMRGVGALILGYYDGGKLIYAGRTGTGFNQKTHKLLRDKLEPLEQSTTPFEKPPAEARKDARWVKPKLVAQVRFATWTADHLVRQAAFLGLREDKSPTEVSRETSAPTPKSSKPANPASKSASHSTSSLPVAAKVATAPKPHAATRNPQPSAEHPPIRLTHPNKVLDPLTNLTKQQLADYYWAVAPLMLPHVAFRPLSLVRCPEGSSAQCFFQKHVNHMLPKGIGGIPIADKEGKVEPYITLNSEHSNREALAGLAQMGVLEVHPWGSRNEDVEHPDRLIFDLDPDESLAWPTVTEAADDVRARLKKLGLTSFLKTTGGKGLHVVIPIKPTLDWPTAKEFAHRFVLSMEKSNPQLYLTKMTKSARAGRIYLDYLRNERGATAVAPYSPRARAGCAVSMPLSWSELHSSERPTFNVAEFADWQARLKKDPWKAISSTNQTITKSILSTLGMKS